MKYSLPCGCGKTIPIETGQAGQTVICSCGERLEVPTMRRIRQLQPFHDDAPVQAQSSRRWSVPQRIVFTLGLIVTAAGFSIAIFYQVSRFGLDTEEVAWDHRLAGDLAEVDAMGLDRAWEVWEVLRSEGIGRYMPPNYILSRRVSDYLLRIVLMGLAVGVGGILITSVAFILPRQRSPASRRRAPAAG